MLDPVGMCPMEPVVPVVPVEPSPMSRSQKGKGLDMGA